MAEETAVTPPKTSLPGIDAAATPLIGLGLGLTGIALGLRPKLAAYPLALTALAAILFRDPRRRTPVEDAALFAPADGLVVAIDELYEHRFLHTDALRLRIRIAPLDVPVVRSPAAGTLRYVEHTPGEPHALWERSEPAQAEQLQLGIEAEWGPLLLMLQAGPLTPEIAHQLELGARLGAGARLATMRFGANVDLLLPADVIHDLPILGARLRAGVTRMGAFGGALR
ncbi:phosphatidylserine decarboxylase [Chloroflexia bacterium SDU3-3]|nr:phosphatidylserine decarboxylase [Chloroflexia bacterium SDU3-3]